MEAFLIWMFKWSLIVFLGSLILIGITTGISRIIEKNTGEYIISDSPDTKKNTTPADTAYSMSNYEYVDEDELERAKKDEERMAEPYVCPECFEPYDGIFCENCGTEMSADVDFCPECGFGKRHSVASTPSHSGRDRKVMYALIGVVAVLAVAILLLVGGVFHSEVPLATEDFEIFTMLTPEGSNFVETSSLPSYGFGGYVGMENAGNYSQEVFSIMVSTIRGGTHPSEVSLDRQEGDITVYKDNQGRNVFYIERTVGEYEFTVIGNDDDTIIKMLNSIKLKD